MDENVLAAQYAQSGNLMDLCSTDAWLQESAVIDQEVNGQVEAGLGLKEYQQNVNALSRDQVQQMRQQLRIQSILFPGLQHWMESWDLGAGFEATYTVARRLIRAHLANLSPTQQALIEQLVDETLPADAPDGLTRQQQVVKLLCELFSQEDWQEMAQTASQSISSKVLKTGQLPTGAIAV